MKKLSEDPGSFVHNSSSARTLSNDSSTLEMTMVASTPVKGKESSSTQPLQPRNSQRPLSSSSFGVNNSVNLPDDSMPVSYRPPLSNVPRPKTTGIASSPVTSNMHQSPTTVFRGGIPFSPGTHRLPPQTSYLFESPQAPRSRALSSSSVTEPEVVVRWP